MKMRRLFLIFTLACAAAGSTDLSTQLLSAAGAGHTREVETLLSQGADVETRDKNGRTPLMLAAQHGRPEVVRLLLSKGAQSDARDKSGLTAYGLALLAPAGRGDHDQALKELPAPPRIRLSVTSNWVPARLQSSCYLPKAELAAAVRDLKLDAVMYREFFTYVKTSGKGLIEVVDEKPDATVKIAVIPGIACEAASGDNLTLAIDVRLFRAGASEPLFERSFGGGLKGLRTQTAHNAAQYAPIFLDWVRPQAGPIYWAVIEKLL
jgi:hypothetical protein